MYYVYLLKSQDYDEIYFGSTNNLVRRLKEHNAGKHFSTKRYKPWRLIYYEAYLNEKLSRMREKRLKYHGNAIRELKKRVLPSTIFSRKKRGAGFTFIEMLVVVTLIGILSLIGVANFRVANQKARDGRRQGDLQQIRAALELYRTDQNAYPLTAAFPAVGGSLSAGGTTYMSDRPGDPLSGYLYTYTSATGTTYTLCSTLELSTATVTGCGSCGTATCRYKITNPL